MPWYHYLFGILALSIGAFTASISLISPAIVVNCGFPLTRKIEALYGKKLSCVRKYYSSTLVQWFFINLIVLVIFVLFVPSYLVEGYAIGQAMTFIFGIFKTGINSNNVSDYIDHIQKGYALFPDEQEKILNCLSAVLEQR